MYRHSFQAGCKKPCKNFCAWLQRVLLCLLCWHGANLMAAERMVNPQDTNAQDAGNGAPSAPYKTLSYAMSQLQPGDHLVIAAGTYRDALLFPQKTWSKFDAATTNFSTTDSTSVYSARFNPANLLIAKETIIEGRGRVIIKGSDIVEDWRALGDGRFVKAWPDETQQVFLDGKSLLQVGGTIFGGFPELPNHPLLALHKTQKGIWPGRRDGNQDSMPDASFYYDRIAHALYLKTSLPELKGHMVEVSTRPELLSGNGIVGVTVSNLEFQHSNTSTRLRSGLIAMYGLHIRLENLHVSLADSTGISLIGDNIILRDSSASQCGQLGIKASGRHMQFIDNETDGNNTRGFNKWWEAGGAKFIGNGGLQDSLVSGHKALANFGDGIWFDWKNRNNTVQNSLAAYNHGFGIQYEASDRARIINNVVIGNQQRGIYLPHSSDSVVAFNLIAGNGMQGIAIIDEGRRDPTGQFDMSARGNKVFSNVIAWNAGALVLPTNLADNTSDGNLFIGDATQSSIGQGWVHMFQEQLNRWIPHTQQDNHSLRMENTMDEGFRESIVTSNTTPDLAWYLALRNKLNPLPVDPRWLKLTPDITDLRPGPNLGS